MKKLILIISTLSLFASCNNSHSDDDHGGQQNEKTHQHDDGSVHQNHDETVPKQEVFEATTDSSSVIKEKDHDHSHNHDHPHSH